MMNFALRGDAGAADEPADVHIAPVPRISIQAFCETAETAAMTQAAADDRRMAKAHMKIQMGGIAAAVEAYRTSPTPNVVMIESESRHDELLSGLDQLAQVCDAGTRVIVIGRANDILLYRELVRRGISDYLIAPITTLDVVRAVSGLFSAPDAKAVGRTIAVVGAKGGVGASTVAHNIAWSIARDLKLDTVVADMDLPFGTAGLDYNQDPVQGIAEAVLAPERIDTAFVDRLLSKCTDHLSLLAAPATLEHVCDFGADAFEHIFDVLRGSRPNDRRPLYCLNMVGVPKRPEIKPADFAKAIEDQPLAIIPFEPQMFGTAANNGQMIAEIASGHRISETFRSLAKTLTGRGDF